jgi:PAS domain S-box-containing protein
VTIRLIPRVRRCASVSVADADGVITYWNSGCERIFGFTAAEVYEQSFDIIIPQDLRPRHWRGWRETMRTGMTRCSPGDLLSIPAQRKDGTRISLEFSLQPFRGADGTTTAAGAIMRDVTKRFEELRALRKAAVGRA